MRFLREKLSDSTSNGVFVIREILSQCRCFIALLAIISSNGHDSLKSSIVFFKSRKACHSLRALGNLRILGKIPFSVDQSLSKYVIMTQLTEKDESLLCSFISICSVLRVL